MNSKDVWPHVIDALEKLIPYYEKANKIISLNRAEKVREYALKRSNIAKGMLVLDAGIGPGNMSAIVYSNSDPCTIVGLDASSEMLEVALGNLSRFNPKIHAVKGLFEDLPFRDGSFDRAIASFSLSDAADHDAAVVEFHRVCKKKGLFVLVDRGKPDNRMVRAITTFYIRYIIPIIGKILSVGKISSNPLRLLIPTYENLKTNKSLRKSIAGVFGKATLEEFMFGGMILMTAEKLK